MPTCHTHLSPRSRAAAAVILLAVALSPACGRTPTSDPAAVADCNRGVALMGRFDYAAAHQVFADLAARYPDDDDLAVNLAVATLNRQQEGDDQAVLVLLDAVLARSPGHLRAHYCRGLVLLHRGEAEAALAHFSTVLDADPSDADASYLRGQCLMQLDRHAEAEAAYQKAIALDPYLRSAYYRAFQALQRLDRAAEGEAMLDTFQRLADNPRSRLVEMKYTKMGRRGAALPLPAASASPPPPPAGELFAAPTVLAAAVPGAGGAITAADLDQDGRVDLVHVAPATVFTVDADGNLTPAQDHPLTAWDGVLAALWGDLDNDGRCDVYLLRAGGNLLLMQGADGSYADVTESAGVAGPGTRPVDGTLVDADHDGDLDILVADDVAGLELYSNNRDGSFRPLAAELGLSTGPGARGLLVADLDGDEDLDILVRNAGPPHVILVNDLLWRYRRDESERTAALRAADVAAVAHGDVDGDGHSELYTLAADRTVTRWAEVSSTLSPTQLSSVAAGSTASLAVADVDGDLVGDLVVGDGSGVAVLAASDGRRLATLAEAGADWALLALQPATGPTLLSRSAEHGLRRWDAGPGRHPFVAVSLTGREDRGAATRSNASGIGALVVARAGTRFTVTDTLRHDPGPGQSRQPLLIGTAGAPRLDYLAIDWSDGVFQTELDLAPGPPVVVPETQRQMSSCPLLFAWDGERFAFVSDLLGVGGMGYLLAPGVYSEPRPWEGFLLPAERLVARDGRLAIKIGEPMEEVTYLDGVRLEAFDLPPGWSLALDERLAIGGPPATGAPIFSAAEALPVAARNERGDDVTASLVAADLVAAPVGELDHRFIGRLAGEHVLTLDFAAPLERLGADLALVVDGWVEYPYSQTNFAAWQAGAAWRAPTLEASRGDGVWTTVVADFGYPAGMPRRMALPLPPLPAGATSLRLTTNLEVYWDRIAVVAAAPCPAAVVSALPLERAELAEVGFPTRRDRPQRVPDYDYEQRTPYWDTRHLSGALTRPGPVEELLAATDNALAIFGPGDEVHLEFAAPAEPPAAGWSRVYRLWVTGWCKDRDRFTGSGATVAPLPAVGEPTAASRELTARLATRLVGGRM